MENSTEFLNKYIKVISQDDRIIIGKLKCIDNNCTLYLTEVVEVFDKNGDYYNEMGLFKNNDETIFAFESEKNSYQIYSPTIVPKEHIKSLIML
jgi:small nuclear ribonucleoprotein (snRNP)-like protein